MFCKIFQTFSTQNLVGQLHILQSLTNSVENFFRTFSTAVNRPFATPLARRQLLPQTFASLIPPTPCGAGPSRSRGHGRPRVCQAPCTSHLSTGQTHYIRFTAIFAPKATL